MAHLWLNVVASLRWCLQRQLHLAAGNALGVSSAMCSCLAGQLEHCLCAVCCLLSAYWLGSALTQRAVGEAYHDGEICEQGTAKPAVVHKHKFPRPGWPGPWCDLLMHTSGPTTMLPLKQFGMSVNCPHQSHRSDLRTHVALVAGAGAPFLSLPLASWLFRVGCDTGNT